MVWALPLPPMVFGVNILCRLLTCKQPYDIPEIVYDNGNDLISVQYNYNNNINNSINNNINSNNIEGKRTGRNFDNFGDNYFDVGAPHPEQNVVVSTTLGKVEGYYMTTSGGRKIAAWEGIRYGRAERWKKPLPVEGWRGVVQAKSPGADCMQFNVRKVMQISGEEDCLFLNVYSPVISGNKKNAKLPVVVYIHGGSFFFGTGRDYGPAYLLNEDIVLVTFNYRLGVLGFMSTGDRILPGNWGLKDQLLAMQWVKVNIASFGGDPDHVTLWGYSAGAVSVHLHMFSNQSVNLFKQGISQGGTAFCHWGVHPPWRARGYTEEMAKRFNCPRNDGAEMVACLRNMDPVSVVAAQLHLIKWMPFPPVVFTPTLEQDNDEEDEPFLSEMPEDFYKRGQVAKKPWIVSTTEHEGLSAIMAMQLMQRWSSTKFYWRKIAKFVLDLDYLRLKNSVKVVDKITRFYLGNRVTSAGTELEYSNMITDRYFHFSVVKAIQAHSELAPTYSYIFSFSKGNYSLGDWNLHRPSEWGAGHGEDEHYFFNSTENFPGFKRYDPEYKLSKIMLNFATNFVINGTPSYTMNEKFANSNNKFTIPPTWEPVTNPRKIGVLHFDEEIRMTTPNLKRVKFWDSLHLSDAKLWVSLS